MSGSNTTQDDDWVRLNVGGKIFATTKATLSRHPESFLSRLVNGGLSSKQDKHGAFTIDRSYRHFDTILNYLRTGCVNFERSEKAMKDLLSEADFYNIQPLVDEIQRAMITTVQSNGLVKRVEIVVVHRLKEKVHLYGADRYTAITMSEKEDDYEVLRALRQKMDIRRSDGIYFPSNLFEANWPPIEAVLRSYGFVEEFNDPCLRKGGRKFVRSV